MTDPVQIRTARLLLRPFHPTDLEAHHVAVWGDPRVTTYLPGGQPRPVAEAQAVLKRYVTCWERDTDAAWAIVLPDSGRLIGECGMSVKANRERDVEISYALAADQWGQGYATEAARACLRFGFEGFGLPYLRAVASPENAASRRVMEKLGMTFEGLIRYPVRTEETLAYYRIERAAFNPDGHPYTVTRTG